MTIGPARPHRILANKDLVLRGARSSSLSARTLNPLIL